MLVFRSLSSTATKTKASASESRRLAERVRDGTITPPELGGATFTISNLGMLDLDALLAPTAAGRGRRSRALGAPVDGRGLTGTPRPRPAQLRGWQVPDAQVQALLAEHPLAD